MYSIMTFISIFLIFILLIILFNFFNFLIKALISLLTSEIRSFRIYITVSIFLMASFIGILFISEYTINQTINYFIQDVNSFNSSYSEMETLITKCSPMEIKDYNKSIVRENDDINTIKIYYNIFFKIPCYKQGLINYKEQIDSIKEFNTFDIELGNSAYDVLIEPSN